MTENEKQKLEKEIFYLKKLIEYHSLEEAENSIWRNRKREQEEHINEMLDYLNELRNILNQIK